MNSHSPISYLFSLHTHSQEINQYHLQKLDNRIIDLDAASNLYTETTHGLEQCILMEFWPKIFPYVPPTCWNEQCYPHKIQALLETCQFSYTLWMIVNCRRKQFSIVTIISHILTKMAPVAVFSFFGPIILALCIKSVTVLIFC